MNLQLGQRVLAKVKTGVCARGERGIVYELYPRPRVGKTPLTWGASILFEQGGYDGFSPGEQESMLFALDEFCTFAATYYFVSVLQLERDFMLGHFRFRARALAPQARPQSSGPEEGGP